jgi:phage tail sheath protein FI
MTALQVPGVYLAERVERRAPVLPTGVPAFVGFVTTQSYGPVALHRKADFIGGALWHLSDAIDGFFDNGGAYCYVIGVHSEQDKPVPAASATKLVDALALLRSFDDIDLVAIPDADAVRTADGIDEATFLGVQRGLLGHCMEQGDRIALLDALPGKDAVRLIEDQVKKLSLAGSGPVNAALYHPWIRTTARGDQLVPPCGHVAGIIARTDALGGVFTAAANIEVLGATDLAADLDAASLGLLNDRGVNCLRAFAARGIRVWGARTLSSAPDWRYLNVRRLVLTLKRWIDLNMSWAAFEPNVPALWARIQRELTHYLQQLWSAGALQGSSSDEAFFVRCDAELNPPEIRESGQVITQIGLAPAVPAEFIVVSVQHRAGTTELL